MRATGLIRSASIGWRPGGWATVRRGRIPPGSGPPGQRCVCRRLPSRDGPLRGGGGPPARPARRQCRLWQPRSPPAPGNTGSCKRAVRGPCAPTLRLCGGVASQRAPPGPDVWRLLRRPARTAQLQTYLIQGPAHLTMAQRVGLAAMRWPIATCFQEGKQLLGLGDYAGRSWIGGHHPMTLCLRAHFFRVRQKLQLQKKRQPGPCPQCAGSGPPSCPVPGRGSTTPCKSGAIRGPVTRRPPAHTPCADATEVIPLKMFVAVLEALGEIGSESGA